MFGHGNGADMRKERVGSRICGHNTLNQSLLRIMVATHVKRVEDYFVQTVELYEISDTMCFGSLMRYSRDPREFAVVAAAYRNCKVAAQLSSSYSNAQRKGGHVCTELGS